MLIARRHLLVELTDAELAATAQACRAISHQETTRAQPMENPMTRGPVVQGSQRDGRLAEELEEARKRAGAQ